MSFIPSEDIELSQEERITLAQARWNEATVTNENPSKAKLARQHDIPKNTLTDRINGRKAASVRNQHFQRLAPKKKQLYVTEFYVFRQQVNDLLRLGSELFTSASMTASSRQKKKKQLIVKLRVRQLKLKRKQEQEQEQDQDQDQKQRNNVISITGQSGRGMRIRRAPKRSY